MAIIPIYWLQRKFVIRLCVDTILVPDVTATWLTMSYMYDFMVPREINLVATEQCAVVKIATCSEKFNLWLTYR